MPVEIKLLSELISINKKINELQREKERLTRRFVRQNADLPVKQFFIYFIHLCGMGPAIYWYNRAFNSGVLQSRKELLEWIVEDGERK